jgi:hypothetical protein
LLFALLIDEPTLLLNALLTFLLGKDSLDLEAALALEILPAYPLVIVERPLEALPLSFGASYGIPE